MTAFLPPGATVEDFAYLLHTDIGDGLRHGIDCRSNRQARATNSSRGTWSN